jgi:hypothetical protein
MQGKKIEYPENKPNRAFFKDYNAAKNSPGKIITINDQYALVYLPLKHTDKIFGRLLEIFKESNKESEMYGKWMGSEFNGYPVTEFLDTFSDVVKAMGLDE